MSNDITIVLEDWSKGDATALDRLAPLVYPQLRQLARSFLRRERAGHTLGATGLVNELFLKLITRKSAQFENRRHFYALSARLMRLALIDYARSHDAEKRGGERMSVPLHEEIQWIDASSPQILDLDRALSELEQMDAEQAQMFEVRFLLGCTSDETAELFHVSKSSVERRVRMARAWLYQRLTEGKSPQTAPNEV
jgi:RNA polymerase sigma-70 factor, ECF subfamily